LLTKVIELGGDGLGKQRYTPRQQRHSAHVHDGGNMRMIGRITLALALAGTVLFAQNAGRAPDFNKAREEAVGFLQNLVRIDTSSGNETKAAEYIKSIFDKEGIPAEIFTLENGRGNVVARLKGNGKKRPVLLMGHTDVVGVEKEKWTKDPFGAEIKDGYLYGRGATDDKDNAAANLEVMLLLHRQKIPLDRDVIYLAEAGEEGSPRLGIGYMVNEHWDQIDSEFALAEGGTTMVRDGKVSHVAIATTEKVGRGLRLVARGTSGHASVPRPDNAIVHLAAAVGKAGQYQVPMRLNDTTRMFFKRLAAISSPEEAFLFTHLEDPVVGPMAQETLRRKYLQYNSMLRTSISPTIFRAGFRSNVIPGDAEATLDIRAVPDEDMEKLVADLKRLIDDPAVEIVRNAVGRPSPPPSSVESEMFRALEKIQEAMFPGAATLPAMLTGATDMSFLRAKGVQSYGISAPALETESGAHSNDERISIEGFGKFVEFIYRCVFAVAAEQSGVGPRD
jgi:acetylornithine deacetylase/succinyl-diaminopimelate desuccinylase-like protein